MFLINILWRLFIWALPLLILTWFFFTAKVTFEEFGLPGELVIAVLVFMLVASRINIPLGLSISINLGGAIIPIVAALFLLLQVPLKETGIATLIMIGVGLLWARLVGKGVAISVFAPPLIAAVVAWTLVGDQAAPVAFISGVFGVLIGADLLRIPWLLFRGAGALSIGGAGVFDAIFLIGAAAALLAGL